MFEYKLPMIDANEKEAILVKIYKENNEYVEQGQTVCTIETTKVAMDIEAEKSGYIEFLFNEDEKVKFEQTLFIIKENTNDVFMKESEQNQIDNSELIITKKAEEYIRENKIRIEDLNIDRSKGILKLSDIKKALEINKNEQVKKIDIINNRKRIVIIGAGAGGEAVADILLDYPEYEIIGFIDDNPRENFSFYGIKVIYNNVREFPFKFDKDLYDAAIIAIAGNMKVRKEIFELYKKENIPFINAIDKSIRIGRNTKIGIGNVIGANTYIGTSSIIGDNNRIAASVNIDHHNIIGNHNLMGPNFTSPGIVKIGDLNMFGANSSLSNYVEIGDENIVMNNVAIYKNLGNKEVIKK